MSRTNVIKLLTELVKTPSLSGNEENIAGVIKDFLSGSGIDRVWIDKVGNVVAKVSGGGGGTLVLEGHMDTVATGNLKSWHVDPFSAKIIDGKLYGRGSADMKGGIASQIAAVSKVKELDIDIFLIYTVLEEVCEGVAFKHALKDALNNKLPDSVVTGEATQLNLGLGHRGRAVIKVHLHGRAAHAALPHEGINSLVASAKLINKINEKALSLPEHPNLGKESIVPTEIDCTPKGLPQTPDTCTLVYDYRTLPERTTRGVLEVIDNVLTELVKSEECVRCYAEVSETDFKSWRGFTETVEQFFPGWLNNSEDVIKELLGSLRDVYTYSSRYYWSFGTDLTYSSGILGIPGYGLGPGSEGVAHTPDEYVSIEEVAKAVDEYIMLVKSFNKILPRGYT